MNGVAKKGNRRFDDSSIVSRAKKRGDRRFEESSMEIGDLMIEDYYYEPKKTMDKKPIK